MKVTSSNLSAKKSIHFSMAGGKSNYYITPAEIDNGIARTVHKIELEIAFEKFRVITKKILMMPFKKISDSFWGR